MSSPDFLIVGHGLAGATLAWRLLQRGAQVQIVDPLDRPAASRVAGGLLAPVGGKRLALAWGAQQCWPAALAFYRQVEATLRIPLLRSTPTVRLFSDRTQRDEYHARAKGPLAPYLLAAAKDLADLDPCVYRVGHAGCVLRGAQLDVPAYLDHSRRRFERLGCFHRRRFDLPTGGSDPNGRPIAPHLPQGVRQAVICTGLADSGWLASYGVRFEPATGEVLRLTAPDADPGRVVQRRVWLAPQPGGEFRVGATFDRQDLGGRPTPAGRAEIEQKLREFFQADYQVTGHAAGVRPIVHTRRPLAGPLPGAPGIAVLTGLGASGTLWAPWVADHLAAWLIDGVPLPRCIDPTYRLAK